MAEDDCVKTVILHELQGKRYLFFKARQGKVFSFTKD